MIENDKNQKDKINEELINTYEISYIFENKPLNRLKTKPTLEKKSDRLDQLKRKIEEIDDCELKSNAKNLVLYDGDFNSPVMIVGEGPGEKEDSLGKPFMGDAGQLLNKMLEAIKIDRKKIYITNVVNYRPPNNRKPTAREINIHKPWLLQQIKLVDPKFILLTGSTAMRAILEVKDPISNLRGQWIKKDGREIMVIFHPSYLLRFPSKEINKPYHLTLKDLGNVSSKLYAV